jgi:hypothetical protein
LARSSRIGADKLELYACYVVPERPESETQDKMDPDSTLWDVKTELQLPREAKFRWGLRVPLRASLSDASTSTIADISAAAVAAAVVTSSSSASAAAAAVASTNTTEESDENSAATSGWLSKRGAGVGGARWKKRWFVREGDRLYYYVSDSTPEPINYIDLHQVQAIPVEPITKDRTAFDITTPSRTYQVRAATVEERARWVAAINGVLSSHHAAERKRIMETLATKRSLVPVKDETLRLTRRDTSNTQSPTQFQSPTLPPKKATMIGEKILPVVPPKATSPDAAAAAAAAAAAVSPAVVPPLRPTEPSAPAKKPHATNDSSLARESMNRLSTLLDLMMDEDAKRECESALSSVATLSSAHVETIKHLQAELLESQLIIAQLTDERDARIAAERESVAAGDGASAGGDDNDGNVEARSRQARFSIRKTDTRFLDRAYVERLEKEFMDAREELEDLRTIVAEIRGVKAALSAVLSPDEPITE